MNELIQIPFNVRSRGALDIGMQFEHNARQVNFFGWSTEATPYFKIDDPVNLLIPLTVDYKFVVSYILTKEWYETTGQLIGIKNDGSYVNETGLFTVKCHKSVGEKPLAEYTDPEYDLVYTQMHEAYLELKEYTEKLKSDVESGEFNGKDYILTEDDKEEIADITKDKIGIDNYVLKEEGKNLSTNDYTNEDKQKVDAIPSDPKYTDTVYDDSELKSKISNTYSKQEADAKFLTEHQDVSMFVTKAVTDLANYYTKSNTYTKTEVNNLISAIPKFNIKVVSELPTNDISSTTIYLLNASKAETGNLYTEYIYVDNKWEMLGSQPSGQRTDVQINGTSIVQDSVANIPIASGNILGLVKNLTNRYQSGIDFRPDGSLTISNGRNNDINNRFINKYPFAITYLNLDYAVKAAMTDGKGPEWTSEEKKAAQERIGIVPQNNIVTKDNIGETLKSGGNLGDRDDIALILRRLRVKYDIYNMLDPNKNDDLTGVHFVDDFTWYIPLQMFSHLLYVGDVYLMDLDNIFKVNMNINTKSLVLYLGSTPAYNVYINPEYDEELNGYTILRYEQYTNSKPIIKVTDVGIDSPYVSIDVFQPYITDFLTTGTKFSFDFSEIDPELVSLLTVEKLISVGTDVYVDNSPLVMILQCSWNDTYLSTTKDILLYVVLTETEADLVINPIFYIKNVNVGNTLTDAFENVGNTTMLPNIIRHKLPFIYLNGLVENTYTYSHTIYTDAGDELFVYKFMDDFTDTLYIGITDEGCNVYNREIENFPINLENIIFEDIYSEKTIVKEVNFDDAEMFRYITSLKVQCDFYLGESVDHFTQFYTNISTDEYSITGSSTSCILINQNGILLVSIQSTILLSRGFNKIVFKLNTTAEPLPLD